jgi:hypothetical protein
MSAAVPAAAAFRAADQVVLPGVARLAGDRGASWRTDVDVTNVSAVPVTVDVIFFPTGGGDNTQALTRPVRLGTIAPGATLQYADIFENLLGIDSGSGALVFFSASADQPQLFEPVVVTGRVYNATPAGTYGLAAPGLPWYDEASPQAASVGADAHLLPGLASNADFRSNLGVWNGSDPSTSIVARIEISNANGQVVARKDVSLPPLAHRQINDILATLGLSGQGYLARVSVLSYASSAANPRPYLFAYGAVIDNRTNDAIFVEGTYPGEEPVGCIFGQ